MRETVVQSTEASAYMAKLVADQLDVPIQNVIRKKFGDGETYLREDIEEWNELMGKSAVFMASTNTDPDLLELYRIGCGMAGYGVKRRIFGIPFFGYSTMERAVKPGEIVTAKANARMLSSIPNTGMGNAFLMMDLHVSGLVHYFEGDCLRAEVYAEKVLIAGIERLGLENFMFGSADLGRPRWIRTFANHFKTGKIALVDKVRDFDKTEVEYVIGNVKGKTVIIYDDMVRSGGSLIKAAQAYLEDGAKEVAVVVSHLAFNDAEAIDRLVECPLIKTVIGTNSHPMSQHGKVLFSDKFLVLDVSGLFVPRIQDLLR